MQISLASSFLILSTAMVFAASTSANQSAPAPVAMVDLERYSGRWYVISNVPYFLERGKVASYDTYAVRPDGRLTNNFTFRKGSLDAPEKTWSGTAKVLDSTHAVWKVSFIWPFSVTYKIYALDPGYRWAVVGSKDASLLWVLARETQLAPEIYSRILEQLTARGISTAKLTLVPQPPR